MNVQKFPRILVCTVNAWNRKVGDNTFPSLLKDYPKECIASLFIREDTPDFEICNNYFRISEKKIIKSVFNRKLKTGNQVIKENIEEPDRESDKLSELYSDKHKFYYAKLFLREMVWKAGRWNTPEFRDFIETFHPDIVIYEMSRYIHLNNIVSNILKISGAKGIGCFWDDTFTYKQEKGFGYRALRFFQRGNLKRLAKKTTSFFAITEKTKREADKTFHIDCTVLTKPVIPHGNYKTPECEYPLKVLYTGNLGIGRLEVLKSIISDMGKMPFPKKYFRVDVYTNTPIDESDANILNTKYSEIHSAVPQSTVFRLQNEADVLLFIESLESKNKIARLSFSTKITDYYSAGKCIVAVGNADLAPMELFMKTDSALVATTAEEINPILNSLLDVNLVRKYSEKAYITGLSNHSKEKIQEIFNAEIAKVGNRQ